MQPKDQGVRTEAIQSPHLPMVLEAGAGSGKTDTMVRRLVTAIEGGTPIDQLVAVTFTRKAAGELRERLQRMLVASANPLCQQAAEQVSDAKIGTIDQLVQIVVGDYALHAGLPTAIRVIDESELVAALKEELRQVLPEWIDDNELAPSWTALSAMHPRVDQQFAFLIDLAQVLVKTPGVRILDLSLAQFITNWSSEGLGEISRMGLPDKLAAIVTPWLRLTQAQLDSERYADIAPPKMLTTGGAGAKESRDRIKAIVQEFTDHWRYPLLVPILRQVQDLARRVESRLRASGRMIFDAALRTASQLLDVGEVRQDIATRMVVLAVDEMQDTSPDQLQFLLKLNEAGAVLFTVGDPRQAIYRFRGADVAGYGRFRDDAESRGIPVRRLTANFRSGPAVLELVDAVAEKHLNWSADTAMDGIRPDELEHAAFLFGGFAQPGEVPALREAADAATIATELRRTPGTTWRDIAILVRSRTHLSRLEAALNEQRVPFRLENMRSVAESPEVLAITAVLELATAESDEARRFRRAQALRSAAFAVSEADLPGALDHHPPLEDLLSIIAGKSAIDAIARIIAETGLEPAAVFSRRSSVVWNRLAWIRAKALALAQEGVTEIPAFLDSLRGSDQSNMAESPVPEADEDAVRVMTVHASKGLEFKSVIVLGFGSYRTRSLDSISIQEGQLMLKNSDGASTPGIQAFSQAQKAEERLERDRLLYVAMTRARNQVAISAWRKKAPEKSTAEFDDLAMSLPDLIQSIDPVEPVDADAAPIVARYGYQIREFLDKMDFREPRATPSQLARENLAQSDDDPDWERDEPSAEPDFIPVAGKSSTAFGLGLHQFMEKVSLSQFDAAIVDEIVLRLRLDPDELLPVVQRAWESSPVRRAAIANNCLREAYFGAMRAGKVLEGVLDLVFQNPDGSIEVVDYKSDRVTSDDDVDKKMADGYARQGTAYADLVEASLGQRPAHVWFVFVRHTKIVIRDALTISPINLSERS